MVVSSNDAQQSRPGGVDSKKDACPIPFRRSEDNDLVPEISSVSNRFQVQRLLTASTNNDKGIDYGSGLWWQAVGSSGRTHD